MNTKVIMVALLFGICGQVPAGIFSGSSEAAKERAETAVVLMNHLNWVVSRVEQNKDNAAIIEEEYENLTDNNINLATIEDEETARGIVDLMSVFTELRKVIMDLDTLHDCVELQRKAAIYKALPSPGVIASPNPYLIAIRLAECTATAYMNYQVAKSEILLEERKERNQIEQHRLTALNEINEDLFWRQWQLVQKHGLADAWRTSRQDCRELVAIISIAGQSDDSKDLVYSYLKRNEARFSYLQIYWYYRMLYALTHVSETELADKDRDDAIYAGRSYIERYREILRKDRTRAMVSMMMVGAKRGQMGNSELRSHLEAIRANMKTQDWDLAYFVAREYISLGLKDEASRVLSGIVDNIEALHLKYEMSKHRFDVVSMKELETNKIATVKASFPSYGLFLCRNLFTRLEYERNPSAVKERIEDLVDKGNEVRKNVSMFEKLGYSELLGCLSPQMKDGIYRVTATKGKGELRFGALKPWLIGGNEKVGAKVVVWVKNGDPRGIDCSPDMSQANVSGSRYSAEKNSFGDIICKTDRLKLGEATKVQLQLIYGNKNDKGGVVCFEYERPFASSDVSRIKNLYYNGNVVKLEP